METNRPVKFDLEDASGETHTYETFYHLGDVGFELSFELIQVLGEPLVRALGDFSDTAKAAVESASSGDSESADQILKGLDFGAALGALREVKPKDILKLAVHVLSSTSRDGVKLKGLALGTAYRANYTEMYSAIWKVVEINNFIPLLNMLSEDEESGE